MSKIPLKIKIFLIAALVLFAGFWLSLPAKLFNDPACFVIDDKDGNLLGASIASDGQWRFPDNNTVPEKFIKCITTFEDKRFYSHPGIDILAFTRATLKNFRNKKNVQGGSTLTMQVIRLSRGRAKRTIWEKIIESIQAVRMECFYSKDKIMALYASHAPFGSNVVGLDAAAWRYFGRNPEELSWGEMASLAVLPNAPALVHPGRNRNVLLKKRNSLLDKMENEKVISSSTADLAKAEPLPGKPLPLPAIAPHLLQRYKSEAVNVTSLSPLGKTTIDINLQKKVTSILDEHHSILRGNGINNACALVLDVETGNVLAYAGNIFDRTRPELESDVDVIKAPRSPGSALKPVLYAAMFTDGTILPNSLVPDIPTQIGGYAPQNFDMKYDGAIPASRALSQSLNIPAVKLLQQYKYPRFYDLLKELGVSTLSRPADNYGLSIILGGSEVTMWDLAGIYAGMARTLNHQQKNKGAALAGDFFSPNYLSGDIHRSSISPGKTINSLDATSIWFAFQAMEEVMRPGEEGLWQQFISSQKIAWKTGTSFGFRDAWAIGITPEYVVAVWTGNTGGEGRPGLIGVQASAPIMFDIFRTLPSSVWFSVPQNNFSFLPVCRQSGFRANDNCPDADTVMVSKNGYRSPLCPYHQVIHLDAAGLFRVDENCEAPSAMKHQSWFILPPMIEYYYKQKNYDYKTLPPLRSDCVVASVGRQMEIIYPENHAKIYVPLEIDGRRGKTVFKATHRKVETKIFWHLDNEFVATTSRIHQVAISPAPGKHVLTIVDASGERVSREFIILAKE